MVGKRIAELRKERGWTQKELAKAARLSKSYIAAIEEGVNPSIKASARIADGLGVEIKELYRKKD